MTSLIDFGAIDAAFPIAGQDNDSTGFRENFSAIQSALATAKSEIEDIQNKAVLVETLGEATETVANDLNGSSLTNGLYSQLNGSVPGSNGITQVNDGTNDIDFDLGPFQIFKINGGDATLRFTNIKSNPVQFSSVRVHLVSDNNTRHVILAVENAGNISYQVGSDWEGDGYIVVDADGVTHTAFEAWTYDGSNVFVRPLGNFLTA